MGDITLATDWVPQDDDLFIWRTADVWLYRESIGWLAKRQSYDGDRRIWEILSCQPDGAPLVFPDADSAMLLIQAVESDQSKQLGAIAWKWDGRED